MKPNLGGFFDVAVAMQAPLSLLLFSYTPLFSCHQLPFFDSWRDLYPESSPAS
jgi:hypothetical protein